MPVSIGSLEGKRYGPADLYSETTSFVNYLNSPGHGSAESQRAEAGGLVPHCLKRSWVGFLAMPPLAGGGAALVNFPLSFSEG